MSKHTTNQPVSEEIGGAVRTGLSASTSGASVNAQTETEVNPHLYENLVSNLQCQMSGWIRRASQELNPERAQMLWWKVDALGYAIRLLYVFKPEFDDLIEKAGVLKCKQCGRVLARNGCPPTDSARSHICYQILLDEEPPSTVKQRRF